MSESAGEGRVLALIEAEFRADDPRLTALFDAFARDSLVPVPPRRWSADRGHCRKPANRLLALLLVPLIAMTVLAMVSGSRKAANSPVPCRPPAAVGGPLPDCGHPRLGGARKPGSVQAGISAPRVRT